MVKILVVEDDGLVALGIKDKLLGLGYEVVGVVASGEKAIKKAGESKPDLVLMDIRIQGEMDGVEVAELIYKRFDIPIIYLTAYADNDTLSRAKLTEPFGYIVKPFEERALHATIEMALHQHLVQKY